MFIILTALFSPAPAQAQRSLLPRNNHFGWNGPNWRGYNPATTNAFHYGHQNMRFDYPGAHGMTYYWPGSYYSRGFSVHYDNPFWYRVP
jgi:hypothetical protein